MRDFSLFATEAFPLHPSSLKGLMICPWRVAVKFLQEFADDSGPAADTGSAMHTAAHALHTGKGVADSLATMNAALAEYPRADLHDAAALFLNYATDPRNRDAKVVCTEQTIAFQISPVESDPTHAPIQVIGTLDQVRETADGRLELWDIKTSKKDGTELLALSTLQVAAYCIGASVLLGRPVHPGGLILPRRYPRNAHWPFTWRYEDIPQLLLGVRHTVAAIRAGHIWHTPNSECTWCAFRSPDVCLPKLQELGLKAD